MNKKTLYLILSSYNIQTIYKETGARFKNLGQIDKVVMKLYRELLKEDPAFIERDYPRFVEALHEKIR